PATWPAARLLTGSVFVVGDSLTVGTEPWLRRDLAARHSKLSGVDARVFRTTAEGLRVLHAKASRLPDTVVLALGTNDLLATQAEVKDWLRQARASAGGRRLIWVNVYVDVTKQPKLKRYRVINDAIEVLAPQYDIAVADWNSYVQRHHVPMQRDGVHYTDQGYRIRASFYARAVALDADAQVHRAS